MTDSGQGTSGTDDDARAGRRGRLLRRRRSTPTVTPPTGSTTPTSSVATRERAADQPEPDPAPSEIPEQSLGLLRAAHPRQAVLTGAAVGIAAFVSGRPAREAAVAGLAVLVVQAILGLLNDVRDEDRDRATGVTGKPVAEGHLLAGNASFVAGCLALVAIPLSLQNGAVAAGALLGYLAAGLLSLTALRRSILSWLPWAISFGLLPAFLAYGGWAGGMHGSPPTYAMTGVAALLGIGVHFLIALPDLVADNKAGVRHLPLRIALRIGAPRLLVLAGLYTAATVVGLLVVAFGSGLRQ